MMTPTRPNPTITIGPKKGASSMISRIIRTFELLTKEPLTAAELARELDINRSTALRLLAELTETGYVTRDAATKRFTLVPSQFLDLVPQRESMSESPASITPVLAEIRDHTGEATILGVPSGTTMVYLAYYSTFHAVAVVEQLGTVRPMHCSALGKAYLSAVDPTTQQGLLRRMSYREGTEHAAHSETDLRSRVRQARRDGFALDLDETFDACRCVAVPLYIKGSLIGAVGISGPSSRLPESRMRELGAYLTTKLAETDRLFI